MDSPFTGLTASIKLGTSPEVLCYISGVDLELTKEIIEVIAFGMQYKEKVPAIKDWSASIDGTSAFASGNSQHDLYLAYANDTLLTVGIYLDDTTYFEGTAFVENLKFSLAADDKIGITGDFAGSGANVLNIEGVLGTIVVTSVLGSAAGSTAVVVSGNLLTGQNYMFKTGATVALPAYDEDLTSWTAWTPGKEIVATDGNDLVIAVVDTTTKKARKAGLVEVTSA